MNEAETRQQVIDRKLALAGWEVDDPTEVTQELYLDPHHVAEPDSGFSDYGLLLDGKPVAVVEAKRTSKDAQAGQGQSLQYAEGLKRIHGGALPFALYTNGYDTYLWESDFYPPFKV